MHIQISLKTHLKMKTKILLGLAGLATAITTQKACFDNVSLINNSSDTYFSVNINLDSKITMGAEGYRFPNYSYFNVYYDNYNPSRKSLGPCKDILPMASLAIVFCSSTGFSHTSEFSVHIHDKP